MTITDLGESGTLAPQTAHHLTGAFMPDTASEPIAQPDDSASKALEHFILGAIPAAAAGLALLVQGLTSVVPSSHRGILYVIVVLGFMASTTVLLYFTSIRIKTRFEKRVAAQDDVLAETHRVVNRIDRSNQALHRKLDSARVERQELKKELVHLRSLIVESAPTIGPSEYS